MDPGNVIEFPNRRIGDEIPRRSEPPASPARRVSVRTVVMVAAAVISCLAVGIHTFFEAPATLPVTGSFSAPRGTHRCETAADDSVVCLNTGTNVRYLFNDLIRRFELDVGEATFTVHPDNRPLEVGSGRLLVRDVDTQFDVYKKNGSTVVTVIQGAIKLLARSNQDLSHMEPESAWRSAPIFRRLEQIEFDEATGTLVSRRLLTEQGLSQLLAWLSGKVDLTNKPLSGALEELARYQPTEETFVYQDKDVRQMRIGGLVLSTNMDDFLDWLALKHSIQHKRTTNAHGGVVITLSRRGVAEAHKQPQ